MRDVTSRAAADDLDSVIGEAIAGEDVVITRSGRREAVVMSWASWARLSQGISFGVARECPLEDGDLAPRRRLGSHV